MTLPCLKALWRWLIREVVVTAHIGVEGLVTTTLVRSKLQKPFYWGLKDSEHGTGIRYLTASKSELEEISDMIVSIQYLLLPLSYGGTILKASRSGAIQNDPMLNRFLRYIKGSISFLGDYFGWEMVDETSLKHTSNSP